MDMSTTHQGNRKDKYGKDWRELAFKSPNCLHSNKALNVAFFFVECTADFLDPTGLSCVTTSWMPVLRPAGCSINTEDPYRVICQIDGHRDYT